MAVQLDDSKCTGCGECVEACPSEALKLTPAGDKASLKEDDCTDCGACVDACPNGALEL